MKDIGNILKEARENKGISIKDVSNALNIRQEYIHSIENGDISYIDKNVYLVGYIKSYSSWLGLNSGELVSKFKTNKAEFYLPGKVSTDTSSFFNLDGELLFPSKTLISFSLLVMLIVFIIMINFSHNDEDRSFNIAADYVSKPSEYKGFNYELDKYGKIMLLAKEDVKINIYYSQDESIAINLKANDIYFFPDERNKVILASDPNAVDIILDDDSGKMLGTLKEYYLKN